MLWGKVCEVCKRSVLVHLVRSVWIGFWTGTWTPFIFVRMRLATIQPIRQVFAWTVFVNSIWWSSITGCPFWFSALSSSLANYRPTILRQACPVDIHGGQIDR